MYVNSFILERFVIAISCITAPALIFMLDLSFLVEICRGLESPQMRLLAKTGQIRKAAHVLLHYLCLTILLRIKVWKAAIWHTLKDCLSEPSWWCNKSVIIFGDADLLPTIPRLLLLGLFGAWLLCLFHWSLLPDTLQGVILCKVLRRLGDFRRILDIVVNDTLHFDRCESAFHTP